MLLMSLLFVSNMAAADVALPVSAINACKSTPSQNDRDIDPAVKKQIYDKCILIKQNEASVRALDGKIAGLQRDIAKCIDDQTNSGRAMGFLWTTHRDATAADYKACSDKAAAMQATIDTQKAELERVNATLKTDMDRLSGEATTAIANADAQRRVRDVVKDEFATMKWSVLDLLRIGDKASAKVDKMAMAIDNSAMGLYLRDRMAGVLSSPAMCKAIKACPGSPTEITGAELNSAFTGKVKMKASEVPKATAAPAPATEVNH